MAATRRKTVRYVRSARPKEARSFWSWDMNPTTILTLLGVAVSAVLTYSNIQHVIADTGEKVRAVRTDFTQYQADTQASRDKYRAEVNASFEKLKLEAAAAMDKFRAEQTVELAKVNAHTDKVEEKVNSIDKGGTDYGRSAYSSQNVEKAQARKDIDEMAAKLANLIPTVTEISANVRWLMHAQGADTGPQDNIPPILRHNQPKQRHAPTRDLSRLRRQ